MHIKTSIFILFSFLIIESCTMGGKITLMNDGSAQYFGSFDLPDTTYSFYESELITNLSDNKGIHFTIKNIDSLGNYLSPLIYKNALVFKYSNDTLRIQEIKNPFYTPQYNTSCHLYLEITSDMKIKDVQSKNKDFKLKKNTVTITKSRKHFKKDEKKN